MTRIAVAHLARGSGKSTVAVSLAGEMRRRNLEAALLDADPGRASSLWAEIGNLDFPVYEDSLEQDRAVTWASDLRRIEIDYLIIDVPSDELSISAALAVAHILVVPTDPSTNDIEAIARLMGLVQTVRTRRAARLRVIIVPNRIDQQSRELQAREAENGDLDAIVVPGIVLHSDFASAFASGRAICESAPGGAADLQIQELCDILQREIDGAAQQ